jgi:hypothetical protein
LLGLPSNIQFIAQATKVKYNRRTIKQRKTSLGKLMETKPALEASLVQEFVGNAHGDLNRVKELLAQEPALIHACWDWGRGDFETGLGAASHMGRRDIAEFLIKNGGRLDLFAATMLGKIEVVKATLDAFPEAIRTPGPHGIPLIAHARAGGDEAKEVLEFLESELSKAG